MTEDVSQRSLVVPVLAPATRSPTVKCMFGLSLDVLVSWRVAIWVLYCVVWQKLIGCALYYREQVLPALT